MAYTRDSNLGGRPGISDEKHNEVVAYALDGKTKPKEAAERSGVGLTKVYEIYRAPISKPVGSGTVK